jgi:hypothetical protein
VFDNSNASCYVDRRLFDNSNDVAISTHLMWVNVTDFHETRGTAMETPTSAPDDLSRKGPKITVIINNCPVVLHQHKLTGLEIKESAISLGLPIDIGFQLSVKHNHGRYEVVGDDEMIKVRADEEFLAVPPDDNS